LQTSCKQVVLTYVTFRGPYTGTYWYDLSWQHLPVFFERYVCICHTNAWWTCFNHVLHTFIFCLNRDRQYLSQFIVSVTCLSNIWRLLVLAIRNEIDLIERGKMDKHNNPLKVSVLNNVK